MEKYQEIATEEVMTTSCRKGKRTGPMLLQSSASLSQARRLPTRAVSVEEDSHCHTVPQQE